MPEGLYLNNILRYLTIRSFEIPEKQMIKFFENLNNTILEYINFKRVLIPNSAADSMAKSLSTNKTITHILLDGFTEDEITAIKIAQSLNFEI